MIEHDRKRAKRAFAGALRQVHLDFHTPDSMPDFLADFSAENFIQTLKSAGVQGIKFFAKCHYGNSYYFTKTGKRHPRLTFDLLRTVIDACKANDILCYTYYSVLFDLDAARNHPEWCQRTETSDFPTEMRPLCPNTPYVAELLLPQVRELAKDYPSDGFFFDIVHVSTDQMTCMCPACRDLFAREFGVKMSRKLLLKQPELLNAFQARSAARMMKKIARARDALAPDMIIIINGGRVVSQHYYDHERRQSHFADVGCVETQPSVIGNYLLHEHYGRYFSAQGIPFELIPVRFMKGWGENTLKPLSQMNYENALIASRGGVINLGDHFPTNGRLDPRVYERMGRSFDFIKAREPFIFGTESVRYAAILNRTDSMYFNRAPLGAEKMLADAQIQTEVIDREMLDLLDRYKVCVVPDCAENDKGSGPRKDAYIQPVARLSDDEVERIARWVKEGGRLIVSGNALTAETADRALTERLMGVRIMGKADDFGYAVGAGLHAPAEYDGFPLQLRSTLYEASPTTATVLLKRRKKVCPRDSRALFIHAPIFPAGEFAEGGFAFVNRYGKGQVMYFAGSIFLDYAQTNHPWLKEMFLHLTRDFFSDSPVTLVKSVPSLRTNLRRGPEGTLFLDLIFAHVEPPAFQFVEVFEKSHYPVIEQEYHLHDLEIIVRGVRAKKVTLEPGCRPVEWRQMDRAVALKAPEIGMFDIAKIEI